MLLSHKHRVIENDFFNAKHYSLYKNEIYYVA